MDKNKKLADEYVKKYMKEDKFSVDGKILRVSSPNGWIGKVFTNETIKLYPKIIDEKLLNHLVQSSKSIIDMKTTPYHDQKITFANATVTEVRKADDCIHNIIQKDLHRIVDQPNKKKIRFCKDCVRGLFTDIQSKRDFCNKKVIHTGGNFSFNDEDFTKVEEYYEELFKMPLLGVKYPNPTVIKLCYTCRTNNVYKKIINENVKNIKFIMNHK